VCFLPHGLRFQGLCLISTLIELLHSIRIFIPINGQNYLDTCAHERSHIERKEGARQFLCALKALQHVLEEPDTIIKVEISRVSLSGKVIGILPFDDVFHILFLKAELLIQISGPDI